VLADETGVGEHFTEPGHRPLLLETDLGMGVDPMAQGDQLLPLIGADVSGCRFFTRHGSSAALRIMSCAYAACMNDRKAPVSK
jgi:hypothetical protein